MTKHWLVFFFSIGKRYHDEVWCDVIPWTLVNCCLSPQQFDRKAIHDGHMSYSFAKDGVKVKLTPLKPEETQGKG